MNALTRKLVIVLEDSNLAVVRFGSPPFQIADRLWSELPHASLGGTFYDFLMNSESEIAGVRFWTTDGSGLKERAVWSRFRDDPRYLENSDHRYVDFLFHPRYRISENRHDCGVDTVQEFGGEVVLCSNDRIGIGFEVPGEVSLIDLDSNVK